MNYFYDLTTKSFLVESIHDIPSDAIPVSETEYSYLVKGRNNRKEIIIMNGSLTLTSIKPSNYHQWDGVQWILPKSQQQAVISAEKSAKLAEINQKAQAFINDLAEYDKTPAFERDTWSIQRIEAKAWFADNNVATPTLDLIAQMRGVPLDVLRQKAYEKAITYQQVAAIVVGQRQAYEDRLNAAETLEEIQAIEPVYSLPSQEEEINE